VSPNASPTKRRARYSSSADPLKSVLGTDAFAGVLVEAGRRPGHESGLHMMSGWTSMFTDIVASTEKAVELGDRAWAELLERHHAVVRREIASFDGREMDTSGDGFFVIFPEPAQAIQAAKKIRAALHELDLQVRIGIHVGDCWVADNKCAGLAIHIGARIAGLARPDEILVSAVAKAESGPAYRFADRGETDLNGIPGRWHLYAVA
jgi:class 3 adenylate cyclase